MSDSRRLLLVEDDPAQRLLLAAYLRQAGFLILEAESLAQARAHLQEGDPHLILLDLGLPDGEGLDLAEELRSRDLPTIIVSSHEVDRLAVLESGADDFVTKPYHPQELVARVHNVLRRCRVLPAVEPSGFGPYRIDWDRRIVQDTGGREVPLTRGEFDLLLELFEAQGRIRSRAQLSEAISPEGEGTCGRSVDVLVSRLRHKLEADPQNPTLLLTAQGHGYRLLV